MLLIVDRFRFYRFFFSLGSFGHCLSFTIYVFGSKHAGKEDTRYKTISQVLRTLKRLTGKRINAEFPVINNF